MHAFTHPHTSYTLTYYTPSQITHPQEKESLVKEQSRMTALTEELGRELQQARLEATEEKKRSQNLVTELEVW